MAPQFYYCQPRFHKRWMVNRNHFPFQASTYPITNMAAVSDTAMTRTLAQAAHATGGVEALAQKLGVTTALLQDWLAGVSEAPAAIYVRALDILIAATKQPRR